MPAPLLCPLVMTAPGIPAAPSASQHPTHSLRRHEAVAGYLFVLPTVLGFLVFVLGPILGGLALGFMRYDLLNPPSWIGFDNFGKMLTDDRVLQIFGNTVYYVVGMILLDLVWALALAVALNSFIPALFKVIFRAVFFFPILVSGAVISIVWLYLFNMDLGIVNYYLTQIGLPKVPWLISSDWVRNSVIIMTVWNGVGFNMLLLLAGLQNIPKELYEAATIDGGGRWANFRKITLPMLSPVIFFILVKGAIGVFQLFDSPFVLTRGGPGDASRTILMYIWEKGFQVLEFGYAAALGLMLFAVILIVTLIQFLTSDAWVFYR